MARHPVELTDASADSIVASTNLKKEFEKSLVEFEKKLVDFTKRLVEFFGAETFTHGRMPMMALQRAWSDASRKRLPTGTTGQSATVPGAPVAASSASDPDS